MRFRDVIGQDDLKLMLARSIDEGRVSHAQIFTGNCGNGTLALAIAYARYLNCTNRRDGDACGECASCHKMNSLAHPDVNYVFPVNSPKGSSGSQKPTSDYFLPQWRETVRTTGGYFNEPIWYEAIHIENQQGIITRNEADEIIKKLSFKAYESPYKVMIIWLPEKMRDEAANALLKILEEPWDRTIFIMVCAEPRKLLSTIISRVQEVVVPGINVAVMKEYISAKHSLQDSQADAIARLSGGSLIEAEKLIAETDGGEADENFDLFVQLMRLSYNDKHMELLEWAETVAALGREEQKRFLVDSLRLLRENYMLNAGMDQISYLWGSELDFSKKFSPFIGNHNIEKLVAEIELAIAQIGQNGNPKIIFSHMALVVSKLIIKL